MSQGTKEALNANNRHNLHTVSPCISFSVGTWTIIPFDVQHDAKEPLGFICTTNTTGETLVYITDTMYVKYKFPQVTHWLIECNYIKEIINENVYLSELNLILRNRIIKNHMSLETLKNIFKENDLTATKEIYLMHLSDKNSDAERMKREIQEITGKAVFIC